MCWKWNKCYCESRGFPLSTAQVMGGLMELSADSAFKIPLVTDHSGGFGTSTGKSFKELSDMAIINSS